MAAIIAVNDLTKSYGRSRGVTHITFSVDEGKVFGFLGPNGAGKTTTIRVLMGLLHPTSGHASIAGLDCWAQSVEVKKLVGYLPGEFVAGPQPDRRADPGVFRQPAGRCGSRPTPSR